METIDYQHDKYEQKGCGISFKMSVVKEVESGFINKRGSYTQIWDSRSWYNNGMV